MDMYEYDIENLRKAIFLSHKARGNGDEPFGAVLADANGNVLLETVNTQVSDCDVTAHAEMNLVRQASQQFDAEDLLSTTLYASGEPCPVCAEAIYQSQIPRVVFALSHETMEHVIGSFNSDKANEIPLSCRQILERGDFRISVEGPILEEEAKSAFAGWVPSPGA